MYAARNFYGTLRVRERNKANPGNHVYTLLNGATVHGLQFEDPAKRMLPLSYYNPESGIGLVFSNRPEAMQNRPLTIGVVGLGVGTLAAYAREGDSFRFYEINPQVTELARGKGGYFSFLKDSAGRIEIVPGDARLSMEREVRQGGEALLDILVVDAFSGDSIPVHLLTREAWDIFLQRLQPNGILAVHISNRYLDLWPVTARLAAYFKLDCVLMKNPMDKEKQYHTAYWVLASGNRDYLSQLRLSEAALKRPPRPSIPLWTDQFSNLLQVLR